MSNCLKKQQICQKGQIGKKGFTQGQLNVFMKCHGLYRRWQSLGQTNSMAAWLLCGCRKEARIHDRRYVQKFLAYLINGRLTRSMERVKRQKEKAMAVA